MYEVVLISAKLSMYEFDKCIVIAVLREFFCYSTTEWNLEYVNSLYFDSNIVSACFEQ